MPSTPPTKQIALLLLLLAVITFAALARRLRVSYPIILVIGGLLLGFLPGMPRITLDPDVVFLVVLPPLLYSAAWNTSWEAFCRNVVSITSLAVGLIAFTVAGCAVVGPLLLPGFDWRAGFVLGAVVAATDSIAATSIAKRVGLPRRIVAVLEGESLVNDATGLLALEYATTMVVYGQIPPLSAGILRFLYVSATGVAMGLFFGLVVEWFEVRIDDGPIEIAISVLVPYATYLSGELVHASGVLSVVAAGLYLGRKSSRLFSPGVRLQARATWNALTFILNGLVFVAIGLQLPYVLAEIRGLRRSDMFLYASVFSVFLIVLRLLWVFPGAFAAHLFRVYVLRQDDAKPSAREVFVIGWTGMRGVIALAAAISLPQVLTDGSLLPNRNLIIFLAFSVILVTLVFQGLTLPPLIRALGLAGTSDAHRALQDARRALAEAALAHLVQTRPRDESSLQDVYDDFVSHYRRRIVGLASGESASTQADLERFKGSIKLARELAGFERHVIHQFRREGRIGNEVMRELEREIDLEEIRLRSIADNA